MGFFCALFFFELWGLHKTAWMGRKMYGFTVAGIRSIRTAIMKSIKPDIVIEI